MTNQEYIAFIKAQPMGKAFVLSVEAWQALNGQGQLTDDMLAYIDWPMTLSETVESGLTDKALQQAFCRTAEDGNVIGDLKRYNDYAEFAGLPELHVGYHPDNENMNWFGDREGFGMAEEQLPVSNEAA